nr:VIT1/CCC1 transporter family protein [Nanchangia anserum]
MSIAGLVIGVAVVDPTNRGLIALAGLSGIASAASSMAVGEYVSVSTQRDTEREVIERQRAALERDPEGEKRELARAYLDRGLSAETALIVATELSERDAVGAHLTARYHLDADDLTNPWHAAAGSFIAFLAGSALPMLAILLFPPSIAVAATIAAVIIALALTGVISAELGRAPKGRAAVRLVIGGVVAMGLGYVIGHVFGTGGIV